jgi:hypothetical protein
MNDPVREWWKPAAACCVGAVIALGLGCAGDGDSEPPLDAISGGWSNEAENRYVCVARDGRLWLGDSPTELDGPNPCTVDGTEFHCTPSDEDEPFDGSIVTSGNQLTIEVVPCPGDPSDCRATYVRDSSLTCD